MMVPIDFMGSSNIQGLKLSLNSNMYQIDIGILVTFVTRNDNQLFNF